MNLEEEVFKIGKQLEKIVGQEGAVSRTFVVECHSICRPVFSASGINISHYKEPIH